MKPVYQGRKDDLISLGALTKTAQPVPLAGMRKFTSRRCNLKNGYRLVSINKDYPDNFASVEDNPWIVGKIIVKSLEE